MKIITICSGKGGVGKSTFAANIAVALSKKDKKIGFLDADIATPSASILFNLFGPPEVNKTHFIPKCSHNIHIMSLAFLLKEEESAIWRGPMLSKMLTQLMENTAWPKLDYLIVDTPPGTGDIHISLFKNYKLHLNLIVTTPQQIALLDTKRMINMLGKYKYKASGIISNMSDIFTGDNKSLSLLAKELDIPVISEVPFFKEIAIHSDLGKPIVHYIPQHPASEKFFTIAEFILNYHKSN